VILGGHHDLAPLPHSSYRKIANQHGTYVLETSGRRSATRAKAIDIALPRIGDDAGAIERLAQEQ